MEIGNIDVMVKNCDCDGLMCQYQQGEITMEEVTEIINSTLQSNGKL